MRVLLQHHGRRLRTGWLAAGIFVPGLALAGVSKPVDVCLEEGRVVVLKAPGLAVFRAGFGATVAGDGVTNTLASTAGVVVEAQTGVLEETPYGPASVSRSTIRFEKEGIDLLFRLETLSGIPVALFQAGISNRGAGQVCLLSVAPLDMGGGAAEGPATRAGRGFQVAGGAAEWVVTGLNNATPVLTTLDTLKPEPISHKEKPFPYTRALVPNDSVEIFEYGGCYREDGAGFLFGPVGAPVAYVAAFFRALGRETTGLTLMADMSGVQVGAGQVRWGQQVALFLEKPDVALKRWDTWVAKTHGARTAQGALSGWSSWYFLEKNVTGRDVLAVATQAQHSGGRLRPQVVQIDRGYEKVEFSGSLETNERFSKGLPWYADKIAATGTRPGIKLQTSRSDTEAGAVANTRLLVQQGYSYLKLSHIYLTGGGGDMTAFERYRACYAGIRKAAGESVYILLNDWAQGRAGLGFVDACRSGYEAERFGVRSIMEEALRAYHLNGRWFAVDNDSYYMATELADVSPVVGGWPLARTWISMVGLSCGAAFTSDPWNEERFKIYWRNVEVLTPPAKERTDVSDLGLAREWPRLVGHVNREWGRWTVALLWNPHDKEQAVTLDFSRHGLDAKRRHAVWSFWDNRYLGVVEGSYTTPLLGAAASQHLCFTPLPEDGSLPALIGSSLHIYCGAAELKRVTATRSSMRIELTDAGARDGDLFLYSRYRPDIREVTGMAVEGVKAAGENVWRLPLRGRREGELQAVALAIPQPVYRQAWFWTLCALLAASLGYGGWRYVVGQKLQRESALARERARIAGDLHDDLGASLMNVAYLGDLVLEHPGVPPEVQCEIGKIRTASRDMRRALDEAVWAVDPEQDTLESLAGYLINLAQELLSRAGIQCRFDFPPVLPDKMVSAEVRHHLLLAFKEVVLNVIRHAQATEVRFRFSIRLPECALTVTDNGRGFDPGAGVNRPGGGHGLVNIRERMDAVGGTCEIVSHEGQGTEVCMTWRLPS